MGEAQSDQTLHVNGMKQVTEKGKFMRVEAERDKKEMEAQVKDANLALLSKFF